MSITVLPIHPLFFAEIRGVDLTRPIPPGLFAEIEAAFNEHAVLLFRDQPVTDADQVVFSGYFGPVFAATRYSWRDERPRLRAEMADISNIDHAGRLLAGDDQRRLHGRANQLWHTDNTFKHIPARCSILSAREIPSHGGDTEFADMRAAFDALPEERRHKIDPLIAEHSIYRSRELMGFTDFSDAARMELPPVRQVLVRQHPATGRKALYIASHASHIIGWPEDEGRQLIEALIAFATQSRFVHRHRWRVGDLIIWDNRCTMHRGRPYAEMTERRVLHRTTVSDEINTVERANL
ncbi:MAG: TauD/TfdA family dioxygenase [Proteobacteria bacterium]|nr:TauD/TfdA family dioxygenase [Pseudomonadota bacterium]